MNFMKRLLCASLFLSFLMVLIGCESSINDVVENIDDDIVEEIDEDTVDDEFIHAAYMALETSKSVKLDYQMSYAPYGDPGKWSRIYIFNDPMIQAGYWGNEKLDSIIYVHEDNIYRVVEYENDFIYEDYPYIGKDHWKLNKIILSENVIENEFTTVGNIRTYPVTIAATKLIQDYPTLASMIKGFQNAKNEKTNPILTNINVDFSINIDINAKRIISIEIDLLDYLVALYEKGSGKLYYDIPTMMQIELSYDDIAIPSLVWADMIADDACASINGRHHDVKVGEVINTYIHYNYDTDLLVLTVDERNFYRMTSTNDLLPNVFVTTSSGDKVEFEISDTVRLEPGTYYIYVSRWQVGEVSLLIELI